MLERRGDADGALAIYSDLILKTQGIIPSSANCELSIGNIENMKRECFFKNSAEKPAQ